MSKADEMFEKLNYAKTVLGYEKNKTIIYENWYIKIEFIEDGHYIKIKADDKLDMQELQAINLKC